MFYQKESIFAANETVFVALLKSGPVGCKDILLPPRPFKRTDVNCVKYKANEERYNKNPCLLRAICLHKTETERLDEEACKNLSQYLDINPSLKTEDFGGVDLEDVHMVERLAEGNMLVYYSGGFVVPLVISF